MGNKLAPSQSYREKFVKFLQNSCDEGELKNRISEISRMKLSEENILSSLLPEDIRNCLEHDVKHMKFLLNFLTETLLSLSQQKKSFTEEESDLVLFLLILLARILPIIYEDKYEDFYKKCLWKDNPNVSVDEIDIEENMTIEKKPKKSKMIVIKSNSLQIKEEKNLWWPYGIKLMRSITNLLFFPGFSINEDISFHELELKAASQKLMAYPFPFNEKILWYPFDKYFQSKPNKFLLENRLLLLKALIAFVSLPYFREHSNLYQYNNPFLLFLTSQKNPYIIEFFFSLLNFLSDYKENGVLPYTGWLNYDPLYTKTAQITSELLSLLLEPNIVFNDLNQNINLMIELQEIVNYYLDLQPQDSVKMRESFSNEENTAYYNACSEILSNYCLTIIANVNDQNYLIKIAKNFTRLLAGNSLEAKNTFLIYSMKEINFLEEILILTWRINENNKYFIKFLLEKQNGFDFLASLLTILHEKFITSFQSGSFNIAISFLTHLSLIREFATSLITPLKQSFIFPSLPVISGNYIDFIIMVLSEGILACSEQKILISSINFTAILLNLSPYIQNITSNSSYKLIQLINSFSNYENLVDNQSNGVSLVKLLKVIDNILVYQGEKNIPLIEVLWRKQQFLVKLEKMRITKKMIIFVRQNKNKPNPEAEAEGGSNKNKSGDENEQLTEISKNSKNTAEKSNRVNVSIRKEIEEEKKITENFENIGNIRNNEHNITHELEMKNKEIVDFSNIKKNQTEEEKPDNSDYLIEWWKNLKKSFCLENIFSILKYLNAKLDGIPNKEIEKKLASLICNQGLIGVVGRTEPIYVEAITDFTIINKVLHEFIWYLICIKNDSLPFLDLNAWRLDTLNVKE